MCEKKLLQEILAYIDTHLQEEITLRQISDAVCYSDEYASRHFRKNTGMNLFDYIRKKRLVLAATEYYAYCEEVGCDIWGRLLEIKPALYEPIGAWLPENLRQADCSRYVQGVEVAMNFPDEKAMDLDCMILEASKYLVFHTTPYECDEEDKNMEETIGHT